MAEALWVELISREGQPCLLVAKPGYRVIRPDLETLGGKRTVQRVYDGTLFHITQGLELFLLISFSDHSNPILASHLSSKILSFLLSLASSRNELRTDLLHKRFLECYSGLEDLIRGIDPYTKARSIDTAVFNIYLETELWAMPPVMREVLTKETGGKNPYLAVERYREMTVQKPENLPGDMRETPQIQYKKHPFAAEFLRNLPEIPIENTEKTTEISSPSPSISNKTQLNSRKMTEENKTVVQVEKRVKTPTVEKNMLTKCRLAVMVIAPIGKSASGGAGPEN